MRRSFLCPGLATLKEAIREADLIELEPHELLTHHSSVVLLGGCLYTAGRASNIPPTSSGNLRSPSQDLNGASGTSSWPFRFHIHWTIWDCAFSRHGGL